MYDVPYFNGTKDPVLLQTHEQSILNYIVLLKIIYVHCMKTNIELIILWLSIVYNSVIVVTGSVHNYTDLSTTMSLVKNTHNHCRIINQSLPLNK